MVEVRHSLGNRGGEVVVRMAVKGTAQISREAWRCTDRAEAAAHVIIKDITAREARMLAVPVSHPPQVSPIVVAEVVVHKVPRWVVRCRAPPIPLRVPVVGQVSS